MPANPVPPDMPRLCKKCNTWREARDFARTKKYKDGLDTQCRYCWRAYQLERLRRIAEGTWTPGPRSWSPDQVHGPARFTPKGRNMPARKRTGNFETRVVRGPRDLPERQREG